MCLADRPPPDLLSSSRGQAVKVVTVQALILGKLSTNYRPLPASQSWLSRELTALSSLLILGVIRGRPEGQPILILLWEITSGLGLIFSFLQIRGPGSPAVLVGLRLPRLHSRRATSALSSVLEISRSLAPVSRPHLNTILRRGLDPRTPRPELLR